jgi:hypothetical protein
LVWLFSYLILNTRKNEKILVYHSPWLSVPVTTARLLKKFEVILEVEEIYSDVSVIHSSFIFLERNLLFSADSYIYSTELLRNRINASKPHLILYGAYKTERPESLPDNDGKIHLLYAGIIDSHKKGAFNAVESTKYLPVQYVLHVIGFGETDKLCKRISELNPTNKCMVMYEGIKNGSDYVSFCQKCHIGLSTQSMEGTYSGSSFPSKILSYLSLGLRVVSCRIECIVESSIENLLTYYNTDSPQEIARAIMSVDVNEPYDSRAKIQQLDGEFVSALSKLLKGNGR